MVEDAPSKNPLDGAPEEVALFLTERVTPERLELLQATGQNDLFGEVWLAAAMLSRAKNSRFIDGLEMARLSQDRRTAYWSRVADLYRYASRPGTSPLN